LARALHRCSVALGETGQRVAALTTAQEAVALFRELVEDVRDAHLPDLTMSVSNLAIRLGQLARLDEAAAAASEAAELSRELVGLHRNAHLSTLAMAMNNQSLAWAKLVKHMRHGRPREKQSGYIASWLGSIARVPADLVRHW